MKRREFAGLSLLAIGSIFGSLAAVASGKKNQEAASMAGEGLASKNNTSNSSATNSTSSSATQTASAQASNFQTPGMPQTFFITITTFFPYPMSPKEYKDLLKGCRNKEESDDLLNAMKVERKLISTDSRLAADHVSTCLEFKDQAAFEEYERRFLKIPGNDSAKKRALGFHSKREFIKTEFA